MEKLGAQVSAQPPSESDSEEGYDSESTSPIPMPGRFVFFLFFILFCYVFRIF